MGKALLAFSTPDVVNDVIENGLNQFTPFTVVTAAALHRELKICRMTQVATTRQELNLNISAVAVPVFIGGGQVVGAIELTTSGAGYQLHQLQSAVLVAARGLSRELTAQSMPEYGCAPAPARPSRRSARNESAWFRWVTTRRADRRASAGRKAGLTR